METATKTVTRYVIEATRAGKPWIHWAEAPDEELIRHAYGNLLRARRTSTRFRLVKRTSVVTDEILEQEETETKT